MPFEIILCDVAEMNWLVNEKARAREADMNAILEGRATHQEIYEKNAFMRNVNAWTTIDMSQESDHFSGDDWYEPNRTILLDR